MSAQAWTIVGIVVGAVLGGLAQVVASRLSARTARQDRLHDERRQAYEAVFIAGQRLRAEVHQFSILAAGKTDDEVDAEQVYERVLEARGQLRQAIVRLQIIGPRPIYEAADKYESALWALAHAFVEHRGEDSTAQEAQDDAVEGAMEPTETFLSLVKHDLGYSD